MMEVQIEFNRHSRRYKQFKVRNTRRTSTPTPSHRPKYQSIRRDPPVQSPKQPPSTCTEVDTTYVSYVQWRHYLVVANSARKFQVRGWKCTPFDSIISGNINMESVNNKKAKDKSNKIKQTAQGNAKDRGKIKVEEELNSRIIEVEDIRDLKEHLERRNRRIMDLIMPIIKSSLKKFVIRNVANNNAPSTSTSRSNYANFLNNFTINQRNNRTGYDDKAKLIEDYDNDELETKPFSNF